MAGKQKRNDSSPTLGGRLVIPILEVKKGERIAGIWSSNSVRESACTRQRRILI